MTHTTALQAQTVSDEAYTAYQNQQIEDYSSLITLSTVLVTALNEQDSIANERDYDKSILYLSAFETQRLIQKMRERGKGMYIVVELNYEQYCLQGVPDSKLCSIYRAMYRSMVADTLMLGRIYFIAATNSELILSNMD